MDIPNYAPQFQIPLGSFKRDNDPYGQILPMLLQGQADQRENRKRQLLAGMFQDNPELNTIAQIDPAAAFKIHQEQINQRPLFQGPDGEISMIPKPGAQPLGVFDKETSLKLMENQGEKRRQEELQKMQIQGNIENRKAMNDIMMLLGQGRLEEAKQRLEETHRQNEAQRALQVELENAKHPWTNAFRSFTGRGPLIQNPTSPDAGWNTGGGSNVQVTNFKVTK